jgi:hypothetical protein
MADPFRFAFVNHVILKLSGIIAGNRCQKGEHNNTFQITQSVKRKVIAQNSVYPPKILEVFSI